MFRALCVVALLASAALASDFALEGPTEGEYYTTYQCPGTTDKDCKCTATKATSTWNGDCPEGYYCPFGNADTGNVFSCNKGDDANNGPQGLYCPANTPIPIYCCKGYYCPTSTQMIECGEGKYCKKGAITETDCPFATYCGKGTSNPLNTFLVFCLFLIVGLAWYIHSKISHAKFIEMQAHSHKLELEEKVKKAGTMTLEQFQAAGGSAEDFSRLDLNSDGVLGYDEMLANQQAAEAADQSELQQGKVKKKYDQTFDFKFEGIGLTLSNGVTIMKGVTGQIKHGKVTAVMGPSGAGKTTFLNLLSGKCPKTHGDIYIRPTLDGKYELEPDGVYKYRKLVGFVPQEDTMHRRLRVTDNIYFNACFRLPATFTDEMLCNRTDEVIKTLGLGSVSDSPIGDETLRGISGGQRKRVNIGMEVVAEPRILFLDEPTSGLDSTSSQEVLLALKEFAVKDDMTIVTVIHQPRLEIYNLLDELLLLGKGGKTVYIGPREEAEVYFAGLGFECADPHMNPIDFFMDIISGDVPRQGYPDFVKEDLFDEWIKYADTNRGSEVETEQTSNPLPEMGSDPSAGQGAGGTEALQTKEDIGPGAATNEDVEVEMKGNTDEQVMAEDEPGKDEPNCCAKCCGAICNGLAETCTDIKNWWTDFFVFLYNCFIAPWKPSYRVTPSAPYVFWKVMQRSLRQQYRDFGSFIGENVLHLVLGLFMGALSSQGVKLVGPIPPKAVDTCPYTLSGACNNPLVDDYPGVAGFLCWAVGFAGIAVGAGTFGNEKPQFWREQGAGMNFITYFYGKVLADVPKIAFAAACFCFAMLAGFATNSSAIKVYAVVFVMYYAGFSLGYLVSAFASREMSALLGVAISMLFAIQLSGTTSPKLKDIDDPDGITFGKIIFFLSYARWGTEAFYINEVTEYEYMNIGPYVASKGYKLGDSQFSKDILNCFLGSLFWQVIALVFLKMNNRQAQK